ncbi:MAG: helix-turn-helix domain-containing protein [Ruminococcaceae bacterium]|nr:helix-turn-helix domain-containing protein [Oscillospiraceae bacterium]
MNSQLTTKPTFSIDVFGIKFKVFRVGKNQNPRINFSKDPNAMRGVHSHFTYEIFFVTEGILSLIADEKRTAYERKVVIIPPKIRHYTTPSVYGSFCLLFSFEESEACAFQKALENFSSEDGVCEMPLSDDVSFYIRKVSEKCEENTLAAEKDAELLTSLIFHEIVRILLPDISSDKTEKSDSRHIGLIEEFINSNLGGKIRLSDVADHVFLSTRQVSRIILKEYGCTLSELVTEKKLARAEMLIKNTDMKIGDIAVQSNLGSENYFYMIFKKHYGMSPLKFRQENRSQRDSVPLETLPRALPSESQKLYRKGK